MGHSLVASDATKVHSAGMWQASAAAAVCDHLVDVVTMTPVVSTCDERASSAPGA